MRRVSQRTPIARLSTALAGSLALLTAISPSAMGAYDPIKQRAVIYPLDATKVVQTWSIEYGSGFEGCVLYDVTFTVNTGKTTATTVYVKSVVIKVKVYDNAYVREHGAVPGAILQNFRIYRDLEPKYIGDPAYKHFEYPGGSITYTVNRNFTFGASSSDKMLHLYGELRPEPQGPAFTCSVPWPELFLYPKKNPYG